METKNYTLYLTFSHYWWTWALPVQIAIEWFHRDYIEIDLQVLCFYFSFQRLSHKYSKKINKMMKGLEYD